MKRVAVLHWLPAEMYPPLVNMVRYFDQCGRWEVELFTTENHLGRAAFVQGGVRVHRGLCPARLGRLRRVWEYGAWQVRTFFSLLRFRPDAIVYIEPQSSFPVFLLSFLRPRVPVCIHHHEYHEPQQFRRPGMLLARWFHGLERWRLFRRARWVSHTNAERLGFFLKDCPEVRKGAGRVLPNYPPGSWGGAPNEAWQGEGGPLRMVYVGSLSLRDTFLAELVAWVEGQAAGAVEFHIFAYNLDGETRGFLEARRGGAVVYHPDGVEYDALPEVLRGFHTGVILYRAKTVNYRFNASNKLFEYLACGLDVVFPSTMEGVKEYARERVNPRVLEVDFESGAGLDLARLGRRTGEGSAGSGPFAEDVLGALEQELEAALRA